MITETDFFGIVKSNPINEELLYRLPDLQLPQCYLTAGSLFQTVWNFKSGQAPTWGMKDYDIFYFDDDLSWEAENLVIQRTQKLLGDMKHPIEVRNQARVHLWYQKRFGCKIQPLQSSQGGIDTFLIQCTQIGIEVATGNLYAPDGFTNLWEGKLQMNSVSPNKVLFEAKANSYIERWPWLQCIA